MIPNEFLFTYNAADKSADTNSEVFVGEKVKLIIDLGDSISTDIHGNCEFRLLTLDNELVAFYPFVYDDGHHDIWTVEGTKLIGELNLDTEELVNIFKGFGSLKASLPFIATLDYLEENEKTSIFNIMVKVSSWQRVTMTEGTVSIKDYKTYLEHLIEENKKSLEGKIDEHVNDKDNPHEVTAKQIGAVTNNILNEALSLSYKQIKKETSDDIAEVEKKIEEDEETNEQKFAEINGFMSTSTNWQVQAERRISKNETDISVLKSNVKEVMRYKDSVVSKEELPLSVVANCS